MEYAAALMRREPVFDVTIAPELRYPFFLFDDVTTYRHGQHGIIWNIFRAYHRLFQVSACGPHLRPHWPPCYALLSQVQCQCLIVTLAHIFHIHYVTIRPQAPYDLNVGPGAVNN